MEGTALNQQVKTDVSDGLEIVSMLYDGALRFIDKAKEKIKIGDAVGRSHFIKKTSAIVKELSMSINNDGGEIALNLRNLYDFVLESLVKADADNDMNALINAERVLDILRSAWTDMQAAGKI
ncbi:MAG: flagellar export chaperone FliS [Nitrospiraceae bacterium]|nr:MAG: flagellar export chaperone FliS [Nitrospiraceae bacterium]